MDESHQMRTVLGSFEENMTESMPLMGIQPSWKRWAPVHHVSRADVQSAHMGAAIVEILKYSCAKEKADTLRALSSPP